MRALPLPPVPRLDLPPWSDDGRGSWEARADRASTLADGAGTGHRFDQLLAEARRLLLDGDDEGLHVRATDRRLVRAVLTAWRDDESLAHRTMSADRLRLLTARARTSRLTTLTIARLFFIHFDRLDEWSVGLFESVRDLLRASVSAQPPARRADLVEVIREHDGLLLEREGPHLLAEALLRSGDDVTTWFRSHHLSGHVDTRLGRIVRDAFYLATIDATDAEHGDHAFLAAVTTEVSTRQRTELTERDQVYFGHLVLEALTAKSTRHPTTAWLEAVLAIGGDPRSTQTQRWRTWWSQIPVENTARAVRWMRGLDLRAFLDGVEAYANATDNQAMQRMLIRRKRLLLGLYEQDRVQDVRLILGGGISQWILRTTPINPVEYARLRDSTKQDTAVIYVDCGDFCLVEGSHNFKLHLYVGSPLDRLANRRTTSFDSTTLRDAIPFQHVETHGPASYLAVVHQGGEWIRKSLDFLRARGITLDERGLMTPNDFADLSRRRAGWY